MTNSMPLIKPEELKVTTLDGVELTFTIHRLPSTVGREIAYQYLQANMPAVGNYEKSKELRDKLMSYVTVKIGDIETPLSSDELIDNQCHDWQTADKIEDAMLRYNCDFLAEGKASIFSMLCQAAVKAYLTPISIPSSEQSSAQEKQPSTS